MKQEVRVADHQKEDILVEEDLHPEVGAEENKFGVTHVENGEMDHGSVLITNQKINRM